MHSLQLHRELVQHFKKMKLPLSRPQRHNLACLCQALAVSANCHLATLALGLPLRGQRENLVQRLRRFLKNSHVGPATCYQQVARHVLGQWSGCEVGLVMDRTDLQDRWSILMLGVAYRKRVVPLGWDVLPFGSTSAARQIALLQRVQPYLPAGVRVHFYGDSEFRAVPLQQTCRDYQWHWQVGLKSDLYFRPAGAEWQALRSVPVPRGERRYLQRIYLTQAHAFGPVNLLADWTTKQETPHYYALDLPANAQAWRRGRKRFWIEPTFRDWKSYGFDLEKSKLADPERLDVLLLGVALTTLWMLHLGDWLIRGGRRHELAPEHKADYSAFRLGRDYVQRCRTWERPIPVGFTVQQPTKPAYRSG